ERLFVHPQLPDDLRPRVEAVLAERRRVAEMISDLSQRIDEATRQWPGPFGHGGYAAVTGSAHATRWVGPGPNPGGRPALAPLPHGWIDDDETAWPAQFRDALAVAVRGTGNQAQRQAVQLRFGLGRTRRVLTPREIAHRVGCDHGRVSELVRVATNAIRVTATKPLPARPGANHRASLIAAHLPNRILSSATDIDFDFVTALP